METDAICGNICRNGYSICRNTHGNGCHLRKYLQKRSFLGKRDASKVKHVAHGKGVAGKGIDHELA